MVHIKFYFPYNSLSLSISWVILTSLSLPYVFIHLSLQYSSNIVSQLPTPVRCPSILTHRLRKVWDHGCLHELWSCNDWIATSFYIFSEWQHVFSFKCLHTIERYNKKIGHFVQLRLGAIKTCNDGCELNNWCHFAISAYCCYPALSLGDRLSRVWSTVIWMNRRYWIGSNSLEYHH